MAQDIMEYITGGVILQSASGESLLEETVTSENVDSFKPSAETAQRAQEELIKLGFDIVQYREGSSSITIGAGKAYFETVFQTTIEEAVADVGHGVTKTYYVPKTEMIVPEELEPWIEAVYLPTPPTMFADPF